MDPKEKLQPLPVKGEEQQPQTELENEQPELDENLSQETIDDFDAVAGDKPGAEDDVTVPPAERRARKKAKSQDDTGEAAPSQPTGEEKPEEKPEQKPEEKPQGLDPKEVLDLGPVKYDRETLVNKLRERDAYVGYANKYYGIFGMTPEQAEVYWKPLLDDIRKDPAMGEYLEESIQHYRDVKAKRSGNEGEKPAQPAVDEKTQKRLDELELADRTRRMAEAKQRVDSEKAVLVEKYPALADEKVMALVAGHAFTRIQQGDGNYTLTQAADDLAEYLTRLQAKTETTTQQETQPQPKPKVPALNGSAGASPAGSRKRNDRFTGDLEDAVDDWIDQSASHGF